MNLRLIDSLRFSSLALCALTLALGCTQTDSVGKGGRNDGAADARVAGGAGSGGSSAVGGSTGAGGTAGYGGTGAGGTTGVVACEEGPTTGDRCTSLPAGKVCRLGDSCVGGCAPDCSCKDGFWSCEVVCRDCNLGPNPVPPTTTPPLCEVFCDYKTPQPDASADAAVGGDLGQLADTDAGVDAGADTPVFDANVDKVVCSGPNPAAVTCVSNKDQCVPSACDCSSEGIWGCTTDCRGNLPLCDAGVGPEAGGTVDGSASCSATTATLSVAAGSVLDGYCFSGCDLPLHLYKDGSDMSLYDFSHPKCGSCEPPPSPTCVQTGIAVTAQGYTYPLSQRFDVAGKCGTQDCTAATCLAPGHYKVVYNVLSKQADGTCGGTPIELAAEFDYPQTTEVKLQFSTLPSCSRNSDCSTGQSCFRGPTSSRCIPTSQTCSSRDPIYGRCMCPDCTCASAGDYWACIT
jgi:hypothetical protein